MLVRVFERHPRELTQLTEKLGSSETTLLAAPECGSGKGEDADRQPTPQRQLRFQRVHALRENGYSLSAIARDTGLDRKTVRKYLSLTVLPPRRERSKAMSAYQTYLLDHWTPDLPMTARERWRDLRAHGFQESLSTVARFWLKFADSSDCPDMDEGRCKHPRVLRMSLLAKQPGYVWHARSS